MRYILKQQIYRFITIAIMVGYTYLQLRRMPEMSRIDWYMVITVNVVGLLAIVVITAKIKIASAHMRHHRSGGH
jgi:hypothetical protein